MPLANYAPPEMPDLAGRVPCIAAPRTAGEVIPRAEPSGRSTAQNVTMPSMTVLIALRRRARRRASGQAWRYRTHHEASADSARIVSAHHEDELDAGMRSKPRGQLKPRAVR
jgi:hypothetical protein